MHTVSYISFERPVREATESFLKCMCVQTQCSLQEVFPIYGKAALQWMFKKALPITVSFYESSIQAMKCTQDIKDWDNCIRLVILVMRLHTYICAYKMESAQHMYKCTPSQYSRTMPISTTCTVALHR